MSERDFKGHERIAANMWDSLGRLEILALFPILTLTATLVGLDDMALVSAFGLAGLLGFSAIFHPRRHAAGAPVAARAGSADLVTALDHVAATQGQDSACFLIQVEEWDRITELWGQDTAEDLADRLEARLLSTLRAGDTLVRLGAARFGIALAPVRSSRLGLREAIAARVAAGMSDPIVLHGTSLRISVAIGHAALVSRGAECGRATLKAADAALAEALHNGPGTIRAYAPEMGRRRRVVTELAAEVESAIHEGSISAWFQPQICAQTGRLSGVETLARWQHPKRGLLSPREFIVAIDSAGLMPLLGETLVHQALETLAAWDAEGLTIPSVSVNLSANELRGGTVIESLASECARYGIAPERLVIEVPADLAARPDDDSILVNLDTLRETGHRVDLDGYGYGPVSLSSLQRLGITRAKIDRAMILGIDTDLEKDRVLRAILAFAGVLGVEVLASGVETDDEMAHLRKVGVAHFQGFGIARPMDAARLAKWVRKSEQAGHKKPKAIRS